jgi:hypothetical protein
MAKSIIQIHFFNKQAVAGGRVDEQKIYEVGKVATSVTSLITKD